MILAETVFVQGRAVGRILVDSNVREIAFEPIENQSRLPNQMWQNVDHLKQAIKKAYTKKSPSGPTNGPSSFPLDKDYQPHPLHEVIDE